MTARGRRRGAENTSQLASAVWTLGEQMDNPTACGVTEAVEDPVEFWRCGSDRKELFHMW